MKRTLVGCSFFIGGCVIFSACVICASLEGIVPSDVQGEKLLSILFMLLGVTVIVREAWFEKGK